MTNHDLYRHATRGYRVLEMIVGAMAGLSVVMFALVFCGVLS